MKENIDISEDFGKSKSVWRGNRIDCILDNCECEVCEASRPCGWNKNEDAKRKSKPLMIKSDGTRGYVLEKWEGQF